MYDVNSHPNLSQNKVGIITIGIWDKIEGIRKFGEIFSALKITNESGYTGKKAFDNVVKYINGTGQCFNKTDEKILRKLQELWSTDSVNLIMNIIEIIKDLFQETSVTSLHSNMRTTV